MKSRFRVYTFPGLSEPTAHWHFELEGDLAENPMDALKQLEYITKVLESHRAVRSDVDINALGAAVV